MWCAYGVGVVCVYGVRIVLVWCLSVASLCYSASRQLRTAATGKHHGKVRFVNALLTCLALPCLELPCVVNKNANLVIGSRPQPPSSADAITLSR
ncbi:unnamed protein product [Toxocara canis]|uniref:Secreted protein n=1 Tax=Toxocara canis TaxID=6265 RepID=A0A183U0U7_TOXCA|nr:unnamed protein product [Toxocara canis]